MDNSTLSNDYELVKNKINLEEYCNSRLKPAKAGNKWICPFCNSGGNGYGSTSGFSVKNNQFRCFACDAKGDIFDLVGHLEHITNKREQLEKVAELAGVTLNDNFLFKGKKVTIQATSTARPALNEQPKQQEQPTPPALDISKNREQEEQYIKKMQANINNPQALKYLDQHGLNLQDAKNYGIGYDPQFNKVVLPYKGSNYYHIDRLLDPQSKFKHYKPSQSKVGKQPIYNAQALKEQAIILVEGITDALALDKLGFTNTIATGGGLGNLRDIIQTLKEKSTPTLLFLYFDKDEQGSKFTQQAIEQLEYNSLFYRCCNDITKDIQGKDPAEHAKYAPEVLRATLSDFIQLSLQEHQQDLKKGLEAIYKAYNIHSVTHNNSNIYFQNNINKPISTGFTNLDHKLQGGLQPKSLYTIGAISSLGKTSFVLQIAHNIAINNQPVLFISIEQSNLELNSKLLSMYTHNLAYKDNQAIPYIELLTQYPARLNNKTKQDLLVKAIEHLESKIQNNLLIMECNKRPQVQEISKVARMITDSTNQPPVIFIDYLQLIAPQDNRDTDKQAVDKNLTELKHLANSLNTPVVIISSVNRDAYSRSIELESFKESGSIEYSCDVVMALDYTKAKQKDDMQGATDKDKKNFKKEIERSKTETISDVSVRILKQRNGVCDYKGTNFKFNKPYSFFYELVKEQEQQAHILEF